MWTGIDIGSYSVKVVQVARASLVQPNAVKVIGAARWCFDSAEYGEIKQLGQETSPENELKNLDAVKNIRTAIAKIFYSGGINPKHCVIGVGGREINLRTILVPPVQGTQRLNKLMEYELGEMSSKSGADFYQDFCPLKFPQKKYPEMPVLIGLAKKAYLDERLKILANTGISISDIYPEPIALLSALLTQNIVNPVEVVMLLDIGATNINVIIHQGGNLLFARNVSGGGAFFTQAIKDVMNISFAQAESLKLTETNLTMAHRSQANPINAAVLRVVGQLHSLFQSSVSFCRSQLKTEDIKIDRVLLSGGGARIKGLTDHLASILKCPTEVFNPFQTIDLTLIDDAARQKVTEEPSDMVIALGLACTAMKKQDVKISFLPERLKKKKRFFQETVYFITAITLLAASIIVLLFNVLNERQYLKSEQEKINPLQAEIVKLKKNLETAKQKKDILYNEYAAYFAETEKKSFFANTLMVISQLFPQSARLSEINLGKISQANNKTVYDSNAIVIKGQLTDYMAQEEFRQFKNNINNNTIYPLLIRQEEEQLREIKSGPSKGKWEFEVVIRKKMN
ncbi:MAG: pilus assembly protein PilM [Planctomycetes bacterium]|nr:pilus assembly protein PilM [Planctomycetota bacterium]